MDPYISVTRGWSDDDVIELAFEVCDGASRFVNNVYVDLGWSEQQATALTAFGQQVHGGIYDIRAGERGPEYAEGAFEARFHYYKPTLLYVSTFQQSRHFDFKGRLVDCL